MYRKNLIGNIKHGKNVLVCMTTGLELKSCFHADDLLYLLCLMDF